MGAADKSRDSLAQLVQGAYYTAYWNNAKHPVKLDRVIKQIYKDDNAPKQDVDVEAFLEKKRRFAEDGGFKNNQGRKI